MPAQSFYGATINDNTVKANGQPETTSFSVAVEQIDDTNILATEAAVAALQTAIDNTILGTIARKELTAVRDITGQPAASSTLAQRENKWLCRYTSAGQKFQVSIGTADLTHLAPHSEFMPLGSGVGAALKTAFENVVVNPDDGVSSVTLDSVQFVGRNT